MLPLLQIKNLSIQFKEDDNWLQIVKELSIEINAGSTTALVGESGSGKSITALSILQLLTKKTSISGNIFFKNNNEELVDLRILNNKEINFIRGNKIGMIFQEPMSSLNPLFTCGTQVADVIRTHKKLSRKEAKKETIKLFTDVELPNPELIFNKYPHQISGGQKQRVMIAMAICCKPVLLIADEPTTALDVIVQHSIMQLLKKLQLQNGMAILLITHDLGLVADIADEVYVIQNGSIIDQGNAKKIISNPSVKYTQALLIDQMKLNSITKKIICKDNQDHQNFSNEQPLLSVKNISVVFPIQKSIFNKSKDFIKAVDDVSFELMQQQTIGIVGESGCGKTTLGRAIVQLVKPTSGNILLNGKDLFDYKKEALKSLRKKIQIVFQDPYGSLHPRIPIGEALIEPMKVHSIGNNNKERKERAALLLQQVGLKEAHLNRYPHQFSGGQRQRICIARALALNPSIIVFDESVSALDSTTQIQILSLINELKSTHHFAAIFISHHLSIVHYISDQILVMKKGEIIEEGSSDDVFFNPTNDYTKQLLKAIPGKTLFTAMA